MQSKGPTLAAVCEEKGDSHSAFGTEARRETLKENFEGIGELAELYFLQNKNKLGGKSSYVK